MTLATVFTAWANFYVITGSSAAALTGLMFVVVTLVDGNRSRMPRAGISTFSTPTIVHFGAAFLVSAIVSAPWPSVVNAGIILGLAGLTGIGYGFRVAHGLVAMAAEYRADLEDWIWYAVLPFASYVIICAAAILLGSAAASKVLFALAAAVLLLIFIGIHNAWDIVTYLAIDRPRRPGSDEER